MKIGFPTVNAATKHHEQQYTDANSENRSIKRLKQMLDKIAKLREAETQFFKNGILGMLGSSERVFLQPLGVKTSSYYMQRSKDYI